MAHEPLPDHVAEMFGGPTGIELVSAAGDAAGTPITDARLRDIHIHGSTTVSATFDATMVEDGVERNVFLVAHASTRAVPDGATQLTVDDNIVHVWRFPNDPYLPGLPAAVNRTSVRKMLDAMGAPAGDVSLRTRSYRPGRRAVVEVSVEQSGRTTRFVYLKVVGASSHERAQTKAERIAAAHRALAAGGLPVPVVVGVARNNSTVAFGAMGGTTLRRALHDPEITLPDPTEVVELGRQLAATTIPNGADPRAFADPTRHLELLVARAGHDRATLERVIQAANNLTGPLQTVHGDFHDGQLLIADGHISAVLDVDGAGLGYAAHDAGALVARVEYAADRAGRRAWAWRDRLIAAYRHEIGWEDLCRATAGAWVGIASGEWRSRSHSSPDAVDGAVSRAIDWLDRLG